MAHHYDISCKHSQVVCCVTFTELMNMFSQHIFWLSFIGFSELYSYFLCMETDLHNVWQVCGTSVVCLYNSRSCRSECLPQPLWKEQIGGQRCVYRCHEGLCLLGIHSHCLICLRIDRPSLSGSSWAEKEDRKIFGTVSNFWKRLGDPKKNMFSV